MDEEERERREFQLALHISEFRQNVLIGYMVLFSSASISFIVTREGTILSIDLALFYGLAAVILGLLLYFVPWKNFDKIREKHIYPLEKAGVLDSHLEDLEYRVRKLEFHLNLIRECLDPDIAPFNNLAIENGLTRAEYKQILDLMDETDQSIREGTPMGHGEFENRVSNIISSRDSDYHFAESIVSTLNRDGKWTAVYEHMKEDGMNI